MLKIIFFLLAFLTMSYSTTTLNCASSQVRSVAINELFNGGTGFNYEFAEIYFNETTNITGWRFYYADKNNDLRYYNIGTGGGIVHYPNGTSGSDNRSDGIYPKGTYIVYATPNLDPTNGEVSVINTNAILHNGDAVVIDYFHYYKTSSSIEFFINDPTGFCSIILSNTDSSAKDFSRLTDGSGDFYQYYPGTTYSVEPTASGSNLETTPSGIIFPTDISLQKSASVSQLTPKENTVTYTIQIRNEGNNTATNVVVRDTFPSNFLTYGNSSNFLDGSALFTCGTLNATSPDYTLTLPTLPVGSQCEWNITGTLKNTLSHDTNITNSVALVSLTQPDSHSENNTSSITVKALVDSSVCHFYASTLGNSITTQVVDCPFDITISTDCNTTVNLKLSLFDMLNVTVVEANLTDYFSLSSSASVVKTITISRAYQNVKILMETNTSFQQQSLDNFAVRPFRFELIPPLGTYKAGEEYNITVQALSYTGIPCVKYNQNTTNLTFLTTKHNPDGSINNALEGNVSFANYPVIFSDGITANFDMSFNDVGMITFYVEDTQWTIVDNNDTALSERTILGELNVTFVPYSFALTASNANYNYGSYTFYSDSDTMYAELNVSVNALNKAGFAVHNFTDGLYEQNVTIVPYFTDINGSIGTLITPIVNQNLSFSEGKSYNNLLRYRYSRDGNHTGKVWGVPTIDINATVGNTNVTLLSHQIENNTTFIYGRVNGFDKREFCPMVGSACELNATVFVEVYGGNIPPPFLTSGTSYNAAGWYILPDSTIQKSWIQVPTLNDITVSAWKNHHITFTYNSAAFPRKQFILLNVPDFLNYVPGGKSFLIEYYSKNESTDKKSQWKGSTKVQGEETNAKRTNSYIPQGEVRTKTHNR